MKQKITFDEWLKEVKNHLVITKRIKPDIELHRPSYEAMYNEGMDVRAGISASYHDEGADRIGSFNRFQVWNTKE